MKVINYRPYYKKLARDIESIKNRADEKLRYLDDVLGYGTTDEIPKCVVKEMIKEIVYK